MEHSLLYSDNACSIASCQLSPQGCVAFLYKAENVNENKPLSCVLVFLVLFLAFFVVPAGKNLTGLSFHETPSNTRDHGK